MQQSHVPNESKKRKNIYEDESDEETSRSAKKIKLSQDQTNGPQPQLNYKSTTSNGPYIEIIDDDAEATRKTSLVTLADHIRSYKITPNTSNSPDPHLQQLYLNILKARNILQMDAAKEVPCHNSVLSAYRHSYDRKRAGWNNVEKLLFAWMLRTINRIPPTYILQKLSGEQKVDVAKKEQTKLIPQPKTLSSLNNDEHAQLDVLMTDFDESGESEVKYSTEIFLLQPESIFNRLSTPKYLQVSNDQKTDLHLDRSQPLFGNLPQTIAGIQLDYTHLPYLVMPKPSEISSNYGGQAASRLIYEKMLEAWQGDNEFYEEKGIKQEKQTVKPKAQSHIPKNEKTPAPRQYSSREAVYMVLKKVGKPLSIKEITRLCLTEGYLNLNGETVDRTIASRISTELKKKEKSWFVRIGPNSYTINPNFSGALKGKSDPRHIIPPEELV